jgi:hypothetical protein
MNTPCKILLAVAVFAFFVLAAQYLRISRYEYIPPQQLGAGGLYVIRIDRLSGHVCWIGLDAAAAQTGPLTLSIPECN